jgi:hypothetical protein
VLGGAGGNGEGSHVHYQEDSTVNPEAYVASSNFAEILVLTQRCSGSSRGTGLVGAAQMYNTSHRLYSRY